MEKTIALLILVFSIIFTPLSAANPCKPDSCDPTLGPQIRFPFRLINRVNINPTRCGHPGFDLYCNDLNQTILNLPKSGEFVVDHIDYTSQALFINDPDSCLPGRILNFTLSGSPFRGENTRNYTFLNCTSDYMDYYTSAHYTPLFCLSGRNYTVLAAASSRRAAEVVVPPPTCRKIGSVLVPLQWTLAQFYWSAMDLREDLELVWSLPDCSDCENGGGVCGYKGGSGPEIVCYRPSKSGLPRSAKYGIIIGVGIQGLICAIGVACYACGIIRSIRRRQLNSGLPTAVSEQRLSIIRSISGLDGPTIESYPTTVLGESRRLPKPSDGTCPICLSDYQPKETLRSIPECNHYFHSDCIDEWLRLNGTCPLCRNSPESCSIGTPFSSVSVSSSSSSSTTLDRN